MADKLPSPWSEEFHTGNATKKIGGDEIQHGVIKDTYNKAKEGIYKQVDKIINNKRQKEAIDAYKAAVTNGRWDLISEDMRALITQMSKDGTVIDKFGNTIKLPPITTSGSRWVDHTKGYEVTTKKPTGGAGGKAAAAKPTYVDGEYQKEVAYNSKKNVIPSNSSVNDAEIEKKRKAAIAAAQARKDNVKAKQADRM